MIIPRLYRFQDLARGLTKSWALILYSKFCSIYVVFFLILRIYIFFNLEFIQVLLGYSS